MGYKHGASASPTGPAPQGAEPLRVSGKAASPLRGATSFMVASHKKTRAELHATLGDQTKLAAAAAYHNIPHEWARFWLTEEANRGDRRN